MATDDNLGGYCDEHGNTLEVNQRLDNLLKEVWFCLCPSHSCLSSQASDSASQASSMSGGQSGATTKQMSGLEPFRLHDLTICRRPRGVGRVVRLELNLEPVNIQVGTDKIISY